MVIYPIVTVLRLLWSSLRFPSSGWYEASGPSRVHTSGKASVERGGSRSDHSLFIFESLGPGRPALGDRLCFRACPTASGTLSAFEAHIYSAFRSHQWVEQGIDLAFSNPPIHYPSARTVVTNGKEACQVEQSQCIFLLVELRAHDVSGFCDAPGSGYISEDLQYIPVRYGCPFSSFRAAITSTAPPALPSTPKLSSLPPYPLQAYKVLRTSPTVLNTAILGQSTCSFPPKTSQTRLPVHLRTLLAHRGPQPCKRPERHGMQDPLESRTLYGIPDVPLHIGSDVPWII